MKKDQNIVINDNQKRSIASSLSLLDEVLCLFEEYAHGREIHSVCYEERNDLTPEQRAKLRSQIETVRAHMKQMKRDLNLPSEVKDVGRLIWGRSAGFWEVMAEMQSKHLKGYGEISPSLAEYLDPRAETLLQCMQTISGIAGGGDEGA